VGGPGRVGDLIDRGERVTDRDQQLRELVTVLDILDLIQLQHDESTIATARPGDLLQKQSQQPMRRHALAGRKMHPEGAPP
jgi:hypothetical protein